MFATFLSPGFAWQTVASHGELAHADLAAVADDAAHPHDDVAHHHDHDAHHHDHDDAAHGQIGHLLSHLPVVVPELATFLPPVAAEPLYPPCQHGSALADVEPPFKPPRSFLRA